jgi:hypothetical protein
MLQLVFIFRDKRGILAAFSVGIAEFIECVNQRFGYKNAAIWTEMAPIVW